MHATSMFEVGSWDEQAILDDNGGPKATRAVVTRTFDGDIAGEGVVEWLLGYRRDGTATFVGLERIVGRLGQRAGTILLQHTGTFDGQLAKGNVRVVPGTGTGNSAT